MRRLTKRNNYIRVCKFRSNTGVNNVKKRLNIDQICVHLWAGTCSFLLILILFFSSTKFACKRPFLSPFLLSIYSLSGIALLYCVLRLTKIPSALPFITGFFAHIFQFWLVKQYYFLSGWDCGSLYNIALNASQGFVNDLFNTTYLSVYPNNLLTAALMTKAFSLSFSLDWDLDQLYALFHCILCLISFFTGLLTFWLAEYITGKRSVAFLIYILYLLLIGASPWVSILYTDSLSLLYPILLLSFYAVKPKKQAGKALKWFFLGFSAFLGYSFKPTAAFPFLAIIILELISSYTWSKVKQYLIRISIVSLGILVAYALVTYIISDFGCKIDPNLRFGPIHYFSMGLNEKTKGIYSQEDVNFAASFSTVKERNTAELLQAAERIENMGIKGLLKHCIRKLLTSFHDGTFAWGIEGNIFSVVFETTDKIALFIRSFYYKNGEHFSWFLNFMQAIWLSVLFLGVCGAGFQPRKELSACLITLLGLVIYLLLFEVRARYVYIFAPIFLVISACGLSKIENRLRRVSQYFFRFNN